MKKKKFIIKLYIFNFLHFNFFLPKSKTAFLCGIMFAFVLHNSNKIR